MVTALVILVPCLLIYSHWMAADNVVDLTTSTKLLEALQQQHHQASALRVATPITTTMTMTEFTCIPGVVYHPPGFVALESRENGGLGHILEKKQFQHGAEVGVQRGVHARKVLENWPSCQTFQLIDLWGHQENYVDKANVQQQAQDRIYNEAQNRLKKFAHKTTFHRMLSTQAAAHIPDYSLDFIYIDARHDYCGVTEDMETFWPKLRPGGLMAGHDYMYNSQVQALQPDQDWSICQDGSIHQSAVRGAVNDFAEKNGLIVTVEFAAGHEFRTWMVQKPTLAHCVGKK